MTALWNIDTILLIVAIFLVIIMFILTIVQNFRRKPTIIGRTAIILLIMGLLFLTLLVFRGHELGVADWAQTLLMIGLVLVTAFYASSANRQADASVKMADEMKEQRYDAFRPIIDIVVQLMKGEELIKQGLDAKEGKFPKSLPCILRNIGVGPALELYSFIEGAGDEPRRWDFGAIPVAIGEEEMGYAPEMRLLLEQRGNHRALVAYYKDVYGNRFESSREVALGKVGVGPLILRSLRK